MESAMAEAGFQHPSSTTTDDRGLDRSLADCTTGMARFRPVACVATFLGSLVVALAQPGVVVANRRGMATVSRLPDYTGSLEVSGSVTVDDGEDPGSLALGFEIHGAEADSTCRVLIYAGTCDDPGGRLFVTAADPWTASQAARTNGGGTAQGTVTVTNGYTRAQVVGRVVVILDSADVAIGCGVIVGSKGWVPEGRWGGGGGGRGAMTAACRSITEEIKAAWSDDKHV